MEESVQLILATQFKEDNQSNYNSYQKEIIASLAQCNIQGTENDLPFTQTEIDFVIKNIKHRNTPGPDEISGDFIKILHNIHSNLLLNIFNAALKHGYFPPQWKDSKLILIPKTKGNQEDPSNFRPICVSSILGKVLEKLINNRLYHFMCINNLHHKDQYGFTHQTSATIALFKLKEKIKQIQSTNYTAIIISLDITGAFNSLWTPFVLHILKSNNCPNNILNLLQDSLSERSISYLLKTTKIIKKGILGSPQGSPMSPLLWNLLISKLLETKFHPQVQVQAFADDITILIHGKSRREIENISNQTLNKINDWGNKHLLEFNPTKSSFLIIGKKYQKRPPLIKLGSYNIKHSKELRILGITFDSQLSFLPHIENIKRKVIQQTLQINNFSGLNWGINPKNFRDIYERAIERLITYGAPVWYRAVNNSHQLRKLKSIQRIPLLKISKAFRTVSNISLNILCNLKPINLTIEKEIFMFKLFQLKQTAAYNDISINPSEIQYELDIWKTHPAKLKAINYTKNDISLKKINIYTDGSVSNDTVGGAFVALDEFNHIIKIDKLKLPKYSTIYDAELIAILEATKFANSFKEKTSFTINSDSLSSLQALSNPHNKNQLVYQVKEEIIKITHRHDIQINYVKSHNNNFRNDLADLQANKARHSGKEILIKKSKNYIRTEINKIIKEKWNLNWRQEGKHTPLYNWIPSVNLIPEWFPSNFQITQILTEHGRFPFYFKRINRSNNNICPCGNSTNSIDHYLKECILTKNQVKEIQKILQIKEIHQHKSKIIKNDKTVKILMDEISKKTTSV